MASLESLTIAQQATTILSNVRRDMRQHCQYHKGRLDATEWTAAYVASLIGQAGAGLVAQLDKIASHQAAVEAALVDWGVSVPDTQADYTQLRTAAVAMRDCTTGNVATTMTQILSGVPAKVRLF